MLEIDPALRIAVCAVLWAGLVIVLFQTTLLSRHRSAGLPLALVLSITLIHSGALVHLSPTYDHNVNSYLASWTYTKETVALGVEVSLVGILGLTLGAVLANGAIPFRTILAAPPRPRYLLSSSVAFIGVGIGATALPVFAGGLVAAIPGLTAIIGGFKNLMLLGICGLILHYTWMQQPKNVLLAVGGGAAAVVFVQMLTAGILGDSVAAAITVIAFALVLFHPRFGSVVKGLAALVVVGYVMLIAAVGWLDVRGEIREAVWGNKPIDERVDVAANAIWNMKVFDSGYQEHLELLDTRLNHNVTIGRTVEHLTAFPHLFANGDTLLLASIGWVPRAVWPDKPGRGGSDVASTYTGQRLSESASFGTGPIFEFFINFGTWGVLVGGIVYGFVLRWLDIRSARIFQDGDLLKAACFFSAGAAMVAPMNSLFFIVNGAVTSALAAWLVVLVLGRSLRAQQHRVAAMPPRRAR